MHLTHLKQTLAIVFLLAIYPSYCQTVSIDSLSKILNSDTLTKDRRFHYLNLAIQNASDENIERFYQEALQLNPLGSLEADISKSIFFTNQGDAKSAISILENLSLDKGKLNRKSESEIYYHLAKNLRLISENEKALLMAEKAIEGAKVLEKGQKLLGSSYLIKGILLNSKGDDRALEFMHSSRDVHQENNHKIEYAEAIKNIGLFHKQRSNYDRALSFYEEYLEIAKSIVNQKMLAVGFNNIGTVHHSKGEYDLALENYVASLKIKEKIGNKRSLSIAYHNVGSIKSYLNDFEGAEIDFRRSLKFSEEVDFKRLTGYNYMKIGSSFHERGNIKEALQWHQKALELAEKTDNKKLVIDTKINIGEDLLANGEYKKAIDMLRQAHSEAKAYGRKSAAGAALNSIAVAFFEIGRQENLDGKPKLVDLGATENIENLLLESVEIAFEINNSKNIENALLALQTFYREIKNYKKEAIFAEQLLQYRDSLFSKIKLEAVSKWETKYETSEKEKEIILLQKEKEIQEAQAALTQNRFIIGFVSLFLLGGIGLMYFYYQNQIERAEQMAAIRNKISSDLHDDVGSILTGLAMQTEVMAMTAKEADKPKLERIGKLSRNAMGRMRDTVWAIDSRKDKIENLIDRMREFAAETLVPKNFSYDFEIENIDESKIIPADKRQNIYLIYKEAVTNIIKHSNGDRVDIILKNKGNELILKIRDNGAVAEKTYKTTGLGISNIERRAKQLGGSVFFIKENGFEVFYKGLAL